MFFVMIFAVVALCYILIELFVFMPYRLVTKALEAWNDAGQRLNEYTTSGEMSKDDHVLYKIPTSAEYFNQTDHDDFVLKERLKYNSKYRELYYKEKETLVFFLKVCPSAVKDHKSHLIRILGYIDDPDLSDKIVSIIFS